MSIDQMPHDVKDVVGVQRFKVAEEYPDQRPTNAHHQASSSAESKWGQSEHGRYSIECFLLLPPGTIAAAGGPSLVDPTLGQSDPLGASSSHKPPNTGPKVCTTDNATIRSGHMLLSDAGSEDALLAKAHHRNSATDAAESEGGGGVAPKREGKFARLDVLTMFPDRERSVNVHHDHFNTTIHHT